MPGASPFQFIRRSSLLRHAGVACLAALFWSAPAYAAPTTDAGGPAPGSLPQRPAPPPPPVVFACADGTQIIARFPDSSIVMLTIGDDRYELKNVVSASGARYAGAGVEFWEHQGKARFTRDGRETECTSASDDSTTPDGATPPATPAE